jgi:uncharacterized membrane protein
MNAGFRFLTSVAGAILSALLGAVLGFIVGRVTIPLADLDGPPAGVGLILLVILFALITGIVGFVFCWRRLAKRFATKVNEIR